MKNSKRRAFEIRALQREEARPVSYAPESVTDNYGHKPLKHLWQDFQLARLDNPSNFTS